MSLSVYVQLFRFYSYEAWLLWSRRTPQKILLVLVFSSEQKPRQLNRLTMTVTGGGGNNSSSEKSKKAMATTWKENTYSAFLNFAINKRCKIPMSPAENNPINAKSTLPKQFIQKSDILGGTTSKVVKKNRKNRKNSCR